jgi:hypothetical protein
VSVLHPRRPAENIHDALAWAPFASDADTFRIGTAQRRINAAAPLLDARSFAVSRTPITFAIEREHGFSRMDFATSGRYD